MTVCKSSPAIACSLLVWLSIAYAPARAQIAPDNTIPSPSSVTTDRNSFLIEGGTTAGTNLFHSFENFSVPTGTEAFFNNAANIDNILTRVTGSNISNIDGLIRANGTANLFLLNPNGIVFGPNARLDIGGSFFGTTASSILFNDGVEFSASDPEASPLLTISVPVGLQFASPAASIRVEGVDRELADPVMLTPVMSMADAENNEAALEVKPDRTLALVGGSLTLDSAQLTVSDGRIELGAVETGNVGLHSVPTGWSLDYSDASSFGDIQLLNQAFATIDGAGTSFMQVRGRTMEIRDGSGLEMWHSGAQPDGTFTVNLSDRLILNGTIPGTSIGSVLRSWTLGAGDGADIHISARQLEVTDGSAIATATFGEGRGGDRHIHAADSVVLDVVTPSERFVLSTIFSTAAGLGEGGNIDLTTQRLTIGRNSSLFASNGNLDVSSELTGSAGNITVNASESVELTGARSGSSTIFNNTRTGGDGGQLTINTRRLNVRDGFIVSTEAFGPGDAGSVIVNASESVTVTGENNFNPSTISAGVVLVNELFFPGASPDLLIGNAGSITINSPVVRVLDGGVVQAVNDGIANGGTLQINVDSILVSDGELTTSTVSGTGGNIVLNVGDATILRRGGTIAAEAGGTGDGGNVSVNTQTLTLLENSRIRADAVGGNGGNIQIMTTGIFLFPDSGITASSQFGVDGLIEITNPDVDSAAGLVELDRKPLDPGDEVATGCASARGSSFTVTGGGNLQENPSELLRGSTVWEDLRPLELESESSTFLSPQIEETASVTEADRWQQNHRGEIELVATVPGLTSVGISTHCR